MPPLRRGAFARVHVERPRPRHRPIPRPPLPSLQHDPRDARGHPGAGQAVHGEGRPLPVLSALSADQDTVPMSADQDRQHRQHRQHLRQQHWSLWRFGETASELGEHTLNGRDRCPSCSARARPFQTAACSGPTRLVSRLRHSRRSNSRVVNERTSARQTACRAGVSIVSPAISTGREFWISPTLEALHSHRCPAARVGAMTTTQPDATCSCKHRHPRLRGAVTVAGRPGRRARQ